MKFDLKPKKKKESTKTVNNLNIMNDFFNSTTIVRHAFRWRYHLAAITIIAAVLAVFFSGPRFITPKYRSVAVIYPSNIGSYSDESETEQLLQWLNSRYIMDSMVYKFNLAERYKIAPDYKHYNTLLQYYYYENVRVRKTPYEAIQIEVQDKDPLVASQMADSIISVMNKVIRYEQSKKYREELELMGARLKRKQHEIDSVERYLYTLRTEYGIIDYPNQSREVARGFLRTVDGNNSSNINTSEVVKLKKNIEEKGGDWVKYNDRFYELIAEYGKYKIEYDWAYTNAHRNITFATVVTKPFPSDKKAFPVRWIIVVVTAFGTFLLSTLIVIFLDNKNRIFNIQQEETE